MKVSGRIEAALDAALDAVRIIEDDLLGNLSTWPDGDSSAHEVAAWRAPLASAHGASETLASNLRELGAELARVSGETES
jgi:hypothetical protein